MNKNTSLRLMFSMTLNCVGLTQFSVIQIIHRSVGLTRFYPFT